MRWLLTLFLFLLGCAPSAPSADAAADADAYRAAVTVHEVTPGEVVSTLTLGAVAEAEHAARLSPLQPGRVAEVLVRFGEAVSEGQVLARMDTRLARLQRQQARSGLELARLQLKDAERELERARGLISSEAITQQALDRLESGVAMAQAQLSQGEASIALLNEQIDDGTIVAPFDGVVTEVGADAGEQFSTMGGLGGPPALVAMVALDPIRLDLQLPERNLPSVSEGMQVRVTSEIFPGRVFVGEVTAVNAAADPGSRTFRVRVAVDNPGAELKPGLFLRAGLVLQTRPDALHVPPEAIAGPQDAPRVLVLDGDRVVHTPVTIGLRGDESWEVTGVSAGDRVATSGHQGLPDGAPVKVLP